jgi:Zn-dependent protease with chaperone function
MRTSILVAALVLGSSALACSALTDDASSQESAHTEGHPTYAQYKWLWADETLDEFKTNAASASMWSTPEFLPTDHPMAQRLQFWVDQMDAALRAANPDALKNTPKPQIILRKDEDPNAWVTYMPVVWRVPTRLTRAASATPDAGAPSPSPDADPDAGAAGDDGGAAADAGPPPPPPPPAAAPQFFLMSTGKITTGSDASPLERDTDEKQIGEFIKFHNEGFAKCRLAFEGGTIVFGEGCAVDSSVTLDRSERIAYYSTSKWVTVTTGLITSMLDEDRIVAVLAHELGHYYRTHSTQPSDQLNYFYALGDANAPTKPAPDPRYLEQTLKVRDKLRSSDWFTSYDDENKLMTEQRLGFYTTEQEADEISLEVLAKIGVPPTLGPDSQLQLHKIVDDMGGAGDDGTIKWEQCSVLRDRGFKDENGAIVSVPVGNLSDPHHSFCFRVFNMTRELTAHAYKIADKRPKPPGDTFAKLVFKMQADLEPPPPPPPPPAPDADAGAPDSDAGAPAPGDAGTD